MDTLEVLKEYEWLLSAENNTNEFLPTKFEKIGKTENVVVGTSSFPSIFSKTIKKHFSPLIIGKIFSQSKLEVLNSVDDNLDIFIVNNLSQISEVEYIILYKKDNYYEIWTVINKLDREVRERIYDVEYDLLGHFRDIRFDFHVTCRDDRNINEIFPTNAIIFYRKL